ncbi:uncharacterized protein LOC143072469 [Mytilus galloprovincialis]|uniref:uncharacterized protein LOC143072469 n=1 Tax=Mytilus galloprovincialis TaxID=29158 RepID=UPI003F7CC240
MQSRHQVTTSLLNIGFTDKNGYIPIVVTTIPFSFSPNLTYQIRLITEFELTGVTRQVKQDLLSLPEQLRSSEDDYFEFEKSDKFGGICNKRTIYNGWGYKPTPGTCDQFYQCDEEGVPHQQSCAAGTFYDGNECRHAEKVHCSYDPCQRKPHGYSYADGQSCYGYFVCIGGRSKYLTFSNGFYFNAHKKSCHSDPTCFKDNLKRLHQFF